MVKIATPIIALTVFLSGVASNPLTARVASNALAPNPIPRAPTCNSFPGTVDGVNGILSGLLNPSSGLLGSLNLGPLLGCLALTVDLVVDLTLQLDTLVQGVNQVTNTCGCATSANLLGGLTNVNQLCASTGSLLAKLDSLDNCLLGALGLDLGPKVNLQNILCDLLIALDGLGNTYCGKLDATHSAAEKKKFVALHSSVQHTITGLGLDAEEVDKLMIDVPFLSLFHP
ncbi:hypothetical protein C8J56DRAFT_1061416 [Mycena floridula]|nr:hypothetical protein C8J56DRAFT_1061416 [Mycena floridula]